MKVVDAAALVEGARELPNEVAVPDDETEVLGPVAVDAMLVVAVVSTFGDPDVVDWTGESDVTPLWLVRDGADVVESAC